MTNLETKEIKSICAEDTVQAYEKKPSSLSLLTKPLPQAKPRTTVHRHRRTATTSSTATNSIPFIPPRYPTS